MISRVERKVADRSDSKDCGDAQDYEFLLVGTRLAV